MRFPLRVLSLTALILVTATAMVSGLVVLVAPPTALAQGPVPVTDPMVTAAPVPAPDKSALLRSATERATRERTVATARARALRAKQLRARVVTVARNQIGDRYSAGAAGPSSFDCSGLTRYVFKVAAGKSLPHQSRAQYSRVKKISRKNALPGDLVFFFRNGAHHVGIYIGKGRMVDAAGYGAGVRISPISGSWWSHTYTGMGRILTA